MKRVERPPILLTGFEPFGGDALKLDCGGGLGAATHVTGAFAFAAVSRVLSRLLAQAIS